MTTLRLIHHQIRDEIGYGRYIFGCIVAAAYVYFMGVVFTAFGIGFLGAAHG